MVPAAKFAFFVISHHNGCAIDHSLHLHSGYGPSDTISTGIQSAMLDNGTTV